MPSRVVRTFSNPDEYAASMRQGTVEMTITERGRFSAKLTQIDLHRLWMQRFEQNLSQISQIDGWGRRAIFAFRTEPGPDLSWSGIASQPTDIFRLSEGQSYHKRSSGAVGFAGMSLPIEEMAALGAALGGSDLTPPKDPLAITPPSRAMAKLQRLHAAAGRMAEDAPEIIAHPEAARGFEQALIEALVDCLAEGITGENRSALRHHALIMRRFRREVEENPDQVLYIPELCKVIAVSERTLRICCQEQLGMSPKRYLMVRRMNLARHALRDSSPEMATVTDIATRYGFWQFGRFAGEYKSLFGEAPSATLHRPRD